jgi:putative membrane protein
MAHKKLTGMAAVAVAGLLTAMTPAFAQNTGTTTGSNTTGSGSGSGSTGTTGSGSTGTTGSGSTGTTGSGSGSMGSGTTGSGSGSMGTSGSMGHDSMGKNGMMGKVSSKDKKFMMDAAMGGMEEVEMGRLAASNATDADVKAFGQRMVDDHTKANDQLKQVAQTKGVTLPTDMSKSQHSDMDKLSKMTGANFDHAYVKMMVKDHKKDVADFSKESKSGSDSDVKSFASTTLPTLQDHLKMVQDLSTKMGGSKSASMSKHSSRSKKTTSTGTNG